MSEQQDPDALFVKALRQFQTRDDGVGGMKFTGEVVAVLPQRRTESLYATLVITEGAARGDAINACLPYRLRRFAKAPGRPGAGRVEVGQVLKLSGRLAQRDGQPLFYANYLQWVEDSGPIERDRHGNVEALTGDPEYEKSFKYADKWKIADHPGGLRSIVLIASRGSHGQQDFTREINDACRQEQRFDIRYRDVPMQGPRAVEKIAELLNQLTPDQGDLAVIVRGGGGWSDLCGFDDPRLAQAIRDCSIPVVTGIGHDNDRHLADFAANYAFAVPREAATALREGKKIAVAREKERGEEEQRKRAAGRFTYKDRPDDPFVTTSGGHSTLPASSKLRAPAEALRPGAQPTRPRPPKAWPTPFDKLSALALISSFLCLGPVALALGLAGCYRTRGHRRRGRWAAVTGSVLGAAMSIPTLVAGYALMVEARAQPGTCIGTFGSWEQVVDSTVDCDQAHRGEIVYRGDVDAAVLHSIRRGRSANICSRGISQSTRQAIHRRRYTLRLVLTGESPHDDGDFVCIATSAQPVRGSLSERVE